jgi:exonuclease III
VDQKAKSVLVAAVQIQEIRRVKESDGVSDSELLDVTAAAVVVNRQCKRVNRGSGSAVVVKKCKYVNTRVRRTKCSNTVHKKRSIGGSTKRKIKFGTWNVRSLSGALSNEEEMLDTTSKISRPLNTLPALMDQMVRLDVDFMGVQETKLKGSGFIKQQEVTLFYSGGLATSKERMHAGVGILVRNKWVKDIEKIFYTSERMMWLNGCFDGEKMAVVVTYAPTDMYAVEVKERYYIELEALYISIPKEYKIKVILGDFNARIGEYMEDVWGKVRGRHVGGVSNDNGDLLLEFCGRNDLFISSTGFEKKNYGTWTCPSNKLEYTIDFCLISLECKHLLVDAGVNRAPECWSDHFFVGMDIKFSVEVIKRIFRKKIRKLDYSALRALPDLRVAVGKRVDECIQRIQNTGVTVTYPVCTNILMEACKEFIPFVSSSSKVNECWFNPHDVIMNGLIVKRKMARDLYLNCKTVEARKKHKEINQEIVRRERVMENDFWLSKADDMQMCFDKNDAKGLHAATKILYGPTVGTAEGGLESAGIKLLDGVTLVSTPAEVNARWLQHCKLLFNQDSVVSVDIEKYLSDPRIVNETLARPFEMRELLVAVKAMKYNKAPGNNGLNIEVYALVESEWLLTVLLEVFNEALRTGVVDKGLKDVIITLLFKKGSSLLCDNYRTLSLINHIGKVLEKMIQFRLGDYCEAIKCLPESQNGFRSDRSTVDAMFVSRLISTSAREKLISIFQCFVDLTKAYDKVNRSILWLILQRLGVPDNLIGLIKGLLDGSEAAIRIKGEIVGEFSLDMGLKQGSVFSPLLFNIFFGAIIDAWQKRLLGKGIPLMFNLNGDFLSLDALKRKIGIEHITILDILFADDAKIIATSAEDLQVMLDIFVEITEAFGQEVSIKKTKVMVQPKRVLAGEEIDAEIPISISIKGQVLENVVVFTYLGGQENVNGNLVDVVKYKLSKMSFAFTKLRKRVFSNRNIRLVTKLRIFDTVVITNGLYGCAIWNINQKQLEKLDSWKFRHLKKILGIKWQDYCSYVVLIERIRSLDIDIDTMEATIRRFQLNYLGHILRMKETRHPMIMLHAEIALGKRSAGGQEMTYRQCIKNTLRLFSINVGKDFEALKNLAQNRALWRKVVRDGSEFFMDNWINNETKRSFENFLPGFLERYNYDENVVLDTDVVEYGNDFRRVTRGLSSWKIPRIIGALSDEVIRDAYKRVKLGEYWRIEEDDSESVTVRGGLSSFAKGLLHKKHVKKYKVIVEEQSRVSRLLKDMRK